MLVHATCVDLAGAGILILGPSGAGKSDLAIRLIADGAFLVGDDQVALRPEGGVLLARGPETIGGLVEVRGSGILPAPRKLATVLRLAVQLSDVPPARLPEPCWWQPPGAGLPRLPLLVLDGGQASAPAKVRITLAGLFHGGGVSLPEPHAFGR